MQSPRMLMHRKTLILHGFSLELQIAAIFSQVFAQRGFFSLKYSLFSWFLLILRVGGCYGEKFLSLVVPQQTALTPEINLSQYAIEIKCLTLKDQTSYLIPDGWSRSPLTFPIFSLNCYITSSTTSKQYKHSIYHGVRSILAYIINNVKAFDIIPWIKYSFKYTSLDRKRYFY